MEVRAGRPEYLGGRLLRFGPLMVRVFCILWFSFPA